MPLLATTLLPPFGPPFFPREMTSPLSLILFSTLLAAAHATARIKCYSCLLPQASTDNFAASCDQTKFCKGYWCTKGPDARSSGNLYGCTDQAPLEVHTSTCKAVNGSRGIYYNCYCNNLEFCNGGQSMTGALPWLIAVAAGAFLLG